MEKILRYIPLSVLSMTVVWIVFVSIALTAAFCGVEKAVMEFLSSVLMSSGVSIGLYWVIMYTRWGKRLISYLYHEAVSSQKGPEEPAQYYDYLKWKLGEIAKFLGHDRAFIVAEMRLPEGEDNKVPNFVGSVQGVEKGEESPRSPVWCCMRSFEHWISTQDGIKHDKLTRPKRFGRDEETDHDDEMQPNY